MTRATSEERHAVRIIERHGWDVTPAEARLIQATLAEQVTLHDAIDPGSIATVAGVDNAYLNWRGATPACAAVVVLTFPDLEVIETAVAWREVTFPYVPGLLSFREGPVVLAACAMLEVVPDLFLFDGQGYAHPRRLGLASHMGIILDRPTVGCAKSRLIGHFEEPEREFGAFTPLIDHDEVIGAAVRTRPRHAPLFVSPGHMVSVESAVKIALACCRDGGFMPVPTRLAHEIVSKERRARLEQA